jgi:hypothetical protein
MCAVALRTGALRQLDPAKALGVGDQVDGDDLPTRNREGEYGAVNIANA